MVFGDQPGPWGVCRSHPTSPRTWGSWKEGHIMCLGEPRWFWFDVCPLKKHVVKHMVAFAKQSVYGSERKQQEMVCKEQLFWEGTMPWLLRGDSYAKTVAWYCNSIPEYIYIYHLVLCTMQFPITNSFRVLCNSWKGLYGAFGRFKLLNSDLTCKRTILRTGHTSNRRAATNSERAFLITKEGPPNDI